LPKLATKAFADESSPPAKSPKVASIPPLPLVRGPSVPPRASSAPPPHRVARNDETPAIAIGDKAALELDEIERAAIESLGAAEPEPALDDGSGWERELGDGSEERELRSEAGELQAGSGAASEPPHGSVEPETLQRGEPPAAPSSAAIPVDLSLPGAAPSEAAFDVDVSLSGVASSAAMTDVRVPIAIEEDAAHHRALEAAMGAPEEPDERTAEPAGAAEAAADPRVAAAGQRADDLDPGAEAASEPTTRPPPASELTTTQRAIVHDPAPAAAPAVRATDLVDDDPMLRPPRRWPTLVIGMVLGALAAFGVAYALLGSRPPPAPPEEPEPPAPPEPAPTVSDEPTAEPSAELSAAPSASASAEDKPRPVPRPRPRPVPRPAPAPKPPPIAAPPPEPPPPPEPDVYE
jgi:hypothetical protein